MAGFLVWGGGFSWLLFKKSKERTCKMKREKSYYSIDGVAELLIMEERERCEVKEYYGWVGTVKAVQSAANR